MPSLTEHRLTGLAGVEAVTSLLQRIRLAHPTAGLYEAAEVQWWWSTPRSTDDVGQLIWFDDEGRPEAAFYLADFSGGQRSMVYTAVTACPFFLPDASPELMATVVGRGLEAAAEYGYPMVELEVDRTDAGTQAVLANHGITLKEKGAITQGWLAADARPPVSPLHQSYRLTTRAETGRRLHHLGERNPHFDEDRLRQTSLYRPDLDLVVLDGNDESGNDDSAEYAAYALFWFDPVTATGVVEPVRTKDDHQRRGLSRHILTSGIERLAQAGAERISIGWEPDNPASGGLYRSIGFGADVDTDLYSGPTGTAG